MDADSNAILTKKWHVLGLLFLVILILISGSYFYLEYETENANREAESRLKTIAEFKASQLNNWNNSRLTGAKIISQNPFFRNGLESWLASPDNRTAREKLVKIFSLINTGSPYENILLTDKKGRLLFSLRQ